MTSARLRKQVEKCLPSKCEGTSTSQHALGVASSYTQISRTSYVTTKYVIFSVLEPNANDGGGGIQYVTSGLELPTGLPRMAGRGLQVS